MRWLRVNRKFFEREMNDICGINSSRGWLIPSTEVDLVADSAVLFCTVVDSSLLALLALTLLLSAVFVDLLALAHLGLNFLEAGHVTALQPWVAHDVSNTGAQCWVGLQQTRHQILELFAVEVFRLVV